MGRTCAACNTWFSNRHFSHNQWTKGDGVSRCKDCVNIGATPRVGEEITSPPHTPAPVRSHPQLQALDNLTALGNFTYDGWQADMRRAEDLHVSHPTLLVDFVEGKMRRKQALYVGDLSHPQLQMLEILKREGLSYVGWESDVSQAIDGDFLWEFDRHVEKIRRKQASHDGDRSHPQLQALDNLKQAGLTYIGWEADACKAEDYHVRNLTALFDGHLEKMREKQALHVGDRSHPQLQALDNLKRAGLTYTGWEADVRRAEGYHVSGDPNLVDNVVKKIQKKQALHVGDYSHPQLRTLNNLKRAGLTYIGWEADVRKVEYYHVKNCPSLIDKCLRGMWSKQTRYTSQQNAQRLPAHVSPIPHQPRESDRRIDDRQNQMAEKQESEECVVCCSSKRTHAFFPCGHMCVCNECANTILRGNSKCPLCRMESRQIAKIYH